MEPSCPKCNTPLPRVETVEYRFCPHCGAEIAAERKQLDDAYSTIPPDSPPPPSDQQPVDLSRETEKKTAVTGPHNDQTGKPQPMGSRQQLNLKPPDTSPPASFFRTPSDKNTAMFHSEKKDAPQRVIEKQRPAKNRNIIIAILIILAMIILLLGGLFTF
jgi:hypothetical protein